MDVGKADRCSLSHFHCLNVDLPGHDKSDHGTWVSLADTADKIAEIIPVRSTNAQAHIVGLSLGVYIALVLLEHHDNMVDGVVISGVTAHAAARRIETVGKFIDPEFGGS